MASPPAARLRIEKIVAGGDGLAFNGGKAVFVPLALPGETVEAVLAEDRGDFFRARAARILEPSPHRVEPACPIYGECGGCNLMHLEYSKQVEAKSRIVTEALRRSGGLDVGEVPVLPSLPFAYRNRLQLHFTAAGRVGFMRRSSSEAVEAPTCPVALRPLQSWIEERAGGSRGFEELKAYVVGKDRFLAFGYRDGVWLEGRDGEVEVEVAGAPIRFHIKGFFQSNLYLLERLVPEAVGGLSGRSAADLYGGVGLFGRFLSGSFERITCVEQDPHALALARANVPGKGHRFNAMSVEDWTKSKAGKERYDCVLVDPPRTGLTAPVRSWLAAARAPSLSYVACDPVTFARDLGELVRSGYRLESVKAFDFYPHTSHVECHARLAWG